MKIFEKDELRPLLELNNSMMSYTFLFIWGQIFFAYYLFIKCPYLLPLIWFFVASRQHALAALAHEAVHGLLAPNKIINNFLGRYLAAFPILVSLSRYQAIHLLHHRKLFSTEDPDRPIYERYPVNQKRWVKYLTRDITARTFLKNFLYFAPLPKIFYPQGKDPINHYPYQNDAFQFFFFQFGLHLFFFWQGKLLYLFLFWWAPYLTLLQVLLRIRGALEHGAIKNKNDELQNTCTVTDKNWVLFFMAPLGLNFHLEHHLYPIIPWYNLNHVHQKL